MKCPMCHGELEPTGQADCDDGQVLDVFQCAGCVVPWEFDGQSFDTALTFAVSASGQLLHPETLEPLSLN